MGKPERTKCRFRGKVCFMFVGYIGEGWESVIVKEELTISSAAVSRKDLG